MAKSKVSVIADGPITLPVNVDECQVEIRTSVSAAETVFSFGPKAVTRECGDKASWIGMANGGAMGLCNKHKTMGEKEIFGFSAQPILRSKK